MLRVGDGAFAPVAPKVYELDISGHKPVQSWLRYRMKAGAGKRSSRLNDIRPERWTAQYTTELLELLWVLETTFTHYPEQFRLLKAIVTSECFTSDELPKIDDAMRKPTKPQTCRRIL